MKSTCPVCAKCYHNVPDEFERKVATCRQCGGLFRLLPTPQPRVEVIQHQPQTHQQIVYVQAPAASHSEPVGATLACLLSFFIPGLGQAVQKRTHVALAWFLGVTFGYLCFIVPGLILHVACIFDAAQYTPE